MNSRKLFAMFLVLALSGSALAIQQQQLYQNTGLTAEGLPAIQQHSVFVEIVVEEQDQVEQIHQFAAVVGLVKKCKQVRNVFDNAVLWFNDQFLFGNKSAVEKNVTPPSALGENPNRTITQEDFTDNNRNNGTALGAGTGDNEGGNPDRDGFVSRDGMRERWGGCFIPNGFVHAIGSDDPYSTGNVTQYKVNQEGQDVNDDGEDDIPGQHCEDDSVESDNVDCANEDSDQTAGEQETQSGSSDSVKCDNDNTGPAKDTENGNANDERYDTEDNEGDDPHDACPDGGNQDLTVVDGPDSIEVTKQLIDLDNDCGGCIFEYVGTFYITDPNNHRWMIDKFVYPLDLANGFGQFPGLGDDPTHCDVWSFSCGLDQERHNDRAEDDGIPEGEFYDNNRSEGDSNPETCPKEDPADQPDETQGCDGTNPGGDCDEPNGEQCENNNENFDNHCNDGPDGECTGDGSDGQPGASFTTKEPMYTVHLQVDPWNPDRQGFPDEAIWAYRDGDRRLGMPYPGDPAEGADHAMTQPCKDQATITDEEMEYDFLEREGAEGQDAAADGDPANPPNGEGREAWADFRRGPVGSTVECAIEYNFLITVDFEAFDDDPTGSAQGVDQNHELETGTSARVNSQDEGVEDSRTCDGEGGDREQGVRGDDPDNNNDTNRCHPGQGHGENEIIDDYKEHGDGGLDNEDAAWQGNSHPHRGLDRCHPEDKDGDGALEFVYGPDDIADVAQDPPAPGEPGYAAPHGYSDTGISEKDRELCWMEWRDPVHVHDAVALDLFFYSSAPFFVEENPYWNNADDPSAETTGTPPIVNEDCTDVEDDTIPADDSQRQAVQERLPIVCDVDAVDGYHLHDGSQTPQT